MEYVLTNILTLATFALAVVFALWRMNAAQSKRMDIQFREQREGMNRFREEQREEMNRFREEVNTKVDDLRGEVKELCVEVNKLGQRLSHVEGVLQALPVYASRFGEALSAPVINN